MQTFRVLFVLFFFLICLPENAAAITPEEIPILNCPLNKPKNRKGEVALCAMFRDDGPFLKEWIEFHRLVGISHFYLYNNCSADNYWEILKPYVEKGIVEIFDVPFDTSGINDIAKTHNFVQVCCYNHAIQQARSHNKWLAIVDTDEFICPVSTSSLPKLLRDYEYAGGLVVYWQMYGTSWIWDLAPGELLIEKLLYKFPVNHRINALWKTIAQPLFATCSSPHTCAYPNGVFAVAPDHSKFSHTPGWDAPPVDKIRINHYTYRTLSFYYNTKKKRMLAWGNNPSPELEHAIQVEANSVYDPVMLKYVEKLHQRMLTNP